MQAPALKRSARPTFTATEISRIKRLYKNAPYRLGIARGLCANPVESPSCAPAGPRFQFASAADSCSSAWKATSLCASTPRPAMEG